MSVFHFIRSGNRVLELWIWYISLHFSNIGYILCNSTFKRYCLGFHSLCLQFYISFSRWVINHIVNPSFSLTFFFVGYIYFSTDSYDITWTMPFCILVLRYLLYVLSLFLSIMIFVLIFFRLIGVTFDVYDGTRPKEQLSSDALKTALKEPPTLLQMLAHSLFPSAFLIGPQFSMRRFLNFVSGKFHAKVN